MIGIPRVGYVEWPEAEIDAHAILVDRTHRPDKSPVVIRWWGIFPWPARQASCCVSCAQDWPCPEMRWAEEWLSSSRRYLRRVPE